MTTTIDYESIYTLLKRQQGTLEDILNNLFDICKDNIGIFNACSYLADLISRNKIEDSAKFIAVFFLLACYKEIQLERNPFIWVILDVSKNTFEPLQREMIADIHVREDFQKYFCFEMENFRDAVENVHEIPDEEKQIEELRAKIQENSAQLEEYTKLAPINLTDQEQIDQIQFLRPIPEYIKISNSEFHWLSPGIISDIQWDNTAEIEKRLDKVRKIFFSSLDRTLEAQERFEILGLIQSDPYCPIQIGFKRQYLRSLVAHNPYLASALVIKVAKTPMLCQYLEQFLKLPTSVQIFDSLCRITKDVCLPKGYLIFFCEHHMKKIIKSKQEIDEKKSVAATMGAFLQCMFQNGIFNAFQIKNSLLEFMNYFEKVIDFAHIKVILEKNTN